jgi:hypothetical protein
MSIHRGRPELAEHGTCGDSALNSLREARTLRLSRFITADHDLNYGDRAGLHPLSETR